MKEKAIEVNEVTKVIRDFGLVSTLAFRKEIDTEALSRTVEWVSKEIDLEEANLIIQNAIFIDNYIETMAYNSAEELSKKLTGRSVEEVAQKLMRTESIRIAVAILKLVSEIESYNDWLYETGLEILKGTSNTKVMDRLDAVVSYMDVLLWTD